MDDYNVVRKNPATGRFIVLKGILSENEKHGKLDVNIEFADNPHRWEFDDLDTAILFAMEDYPMHGIAVHPECTDDDTINKPKQ